MGVDVSKGVVEERKVERGGAVPVLETATVGKGGVGYSRNDRRESVVVFKHGSFARATNWLSGL